MALATQRAAVTMLRLVLPSLVLSCSEFSLNDSDETILNPLTVEESFLHESDPSVDILLVIDDTASMRTEHTMLTTQLPMLVSALQRSSASWHIGTITTDTISDDAGVLRGDPWVLTSMTPDPTTVLTDMTNVGDQGSQPEAGLATAMWALSPPLINDLNRGLRRPDAALHIVIISDGDDHSDEILGDEATSMFEAFLETHRTNSGTPAKLSALVGPSPDGCTGSSGTAQGGQKYIEAATRSGGFISSICDVDLLAVGEWITDTSQPESPRFLLQATPRPKSVRVQVDEARWDDGWRLIEPATIEFSTKPRPGAEIRVRYEVLSS